MHLSEYGSPLLVLVEVPDRTSVSRPASALDYMPLTISIGIAVSGGVDSMALAALCAKLQERHQSIYRPRFHAFVVDHRARPYSNGEAKTVASRLRNMGKT